MRVLRNRASGPEISSSTPSVRLSVRASSPEMMARPAAAEAVSGSAARRTLQISPWSRACLTSARVLPQAVMRMPRARCIQLLTRRRFASRAIFSGESSAGSAHVVLSLRRSANRAASRLSASVPSRNAAFLRTSPRGAAAFAAVLNAAQRASRGGTAAFTRASVRRWSTSTAQRCLAYGAGMVNGSLRRVNSSPRFEPTPRSYSSISARSQARSFSVK